METMFQDHIHLEELVSDSTLVTPLNITSTSIFESHSTMFILLIQSISLAIIYHVKHDLKLNNLADHVL